MQCTHVIYLGYYNNSTRHSVYIHTTTEVFLNTFLPETRAESLAVPKLSRFNTCCHRQSLSVQFSRSVVSDSLPPHGLQHSRLPCPSPTPRACSNSCPSSWLCHPTISSSVIPFSSCLQSFPESGSFPMSQFFASGGQKYLSFSFSISPSNEYSGPISFRMDWLDLLAVQGTLKSLVQHHSSKASILRRSAFLIVQLSHPYMTTGKTIALTRRIFVDKVMSLLFNMLSRLVITFLPRSKHLLISWLQSNEIRPILRHIVIKFENTESK